MSTVLAVRHLAFEDLGLIEPMLADRGHTLPYLDAGIDPIGNQSLLEPDLAVVLGGPTGVAEVDRGAVRLASAPACPNQAYAIGAEILGLQFHLETPPTDLERWLIGHAEALAAAGLDPRHLRHEAAEAGPGLMAAAADRVLADWFTAIGL